jgi:hypothetical protein
MENKIRARPLCCLRDFRKTALIACGWSGFSDVVSHGEEELVISSVLRG